MNGMVDWYLRQALIGLVILVVVLASYVFGAEPVLPPHLRTRPREVLNGRIAGRAGTNLVVNIHTNVVVYRAPVTGFQRVNGKMRQVVVAPSAPIKTNDVTLTYLLIGYPNWQAAVEGDRIRVQVVHTLGPGGVKQAYYAGRVAPKDTGRVLE